MYYLYIVWENDFSLSFGCINKSCCEEALVYLIRITWSSGVYCSILQHMVCAYCAYKTAYINYDIV